MPCIPPLIVYTVFSVIFTSLKNTRSATPCVFIRIDICILCFHINYLYHCAIITYILYFTTKIYYGLNNLYMQDTGPLPPSCVFVELEL